jgi:V8-like Glu-specific endopeptidase
MNPMRTPIRARASRLAATTGLLAALLLPACGEPLDDATDDGTTTAAVTGGAPSGDAVVIMARPRSYCSGTKVGRRRFLTAAHCVRGLAAEGTISISNQPDGQITASDLYPIDKVYVHPSWNVVLANGAAYDVALVDLTVDTPNIPTAGIDPSVFGDGTKGLVVGYGCDATNPARNGIKQQGDFKQLSQSQFIMVANQAKDIADEYAHWLMNASAGIQVCPGDSGGPVLRTNGGATVVSGVTSRYTSVGSTLYSVESRTFPVRNWISTPVINNFVSNLSGNFINYNSGQCIGVPGASQTNGAAASQFYCDGRINQSWKIVQHGSTPYFVLHNNNSDRCMGVGGSSKASGATLGQFGCDGKLNQDWQFVASGTDTYEIVNRNSGLCMGVPNASPNIDTQLAQFPCDGSNSQRWVFTP